MSDDDISDDETYSITTSKTIYKRSRPRSSGTSSKTRTLPQLLVTSDSESSDNRRVFGSSSYLPVTRWAVDYNNRNYMRSKCNKNTGRHRRVRGRPSDWEIEYDNTYFTRSNVNAPKGLHRKIPEIVRKYVPDKDELGDATGWEFDYGPEFDHVDQKDVLYIPEGRIIARGGYRWYGVKRNDSDCDIKEQELRENLLNEELEEELKYGHEFQQADIPHLVKAKDRQYSKGGYRFYEVPRNVYDIKPEEIVGALHDPEWKRKHHSNGFHYLDLEMCRFGEDDYADRPYPKKGKPFRRTVLNKIYELRKKEDSRHSLNRRGTRLNLIPGEGEQTLYEGVPDRDDSGKRTFKKESDSEEFEEYERVESERRYMGHLRPEYEDRIHSMAVDAPRRHKSVSDESISIKERERRREFDVKSEFVEKEKHKVKDYDRDEHYARVKHESDRTDRHSPPENLRMKRIEDYRDDHPKSSTRHGRGYGEYDTDQVKPSQGKGETSKKLPPHVEERVKEIRERMEKRLSELDLKHPGHRQDSGIEDIDTMELMRHKGHPKDQGHTDHSYYEKYVTKNGSEIWVKKQEKVLELHHRAD